jgi:hypothetical protein
VILPAILYVVGNGTERDKFFISFRVLCPIGPGSKTGLRFSAPATRTWGRFDPIVENATMSVWIYGDTSKEVGDPDHLRVFANEEAADTWLQENDPEGVAFEYEVME